MDFNILVNQRVASEWDLTLKQAFFFAYLFKLPTWSTKAKMIDDDPNPYHWVTQKKIIEDLPILNIKPESIRTYFKPLEDKGLIKKITKQSPSGSMMYIQVTAMAKEKWVADWNISEATCKNNTSHPQKIAGAHPQKIADNHNTINHETNITPIVPNGDNTQFFDTVKKIYNEELGDIQRIEVLNSSRKRRLKAIIKQFPNFKNEEKWRGFFKYVKTSSLVKFNGNDGGWKVNFDWIIADKNFVRIVEGQYHTN